MKLNRILLALGLLVMITLPPVMLSGCVQVKSPLVEIDGQGYPNDQGNKP